MLGMQLKGRVSADLQGDCAAWQRDCPTWGMGCDADQMNIAALLAENQRLRRLAERLHDHFSPADREQFPQHEDEICRVFFMDPAEQDAYWFNEARRALGMHAFSEAAACQHVATPQLLDELFHAEAQGSYLH